MSSIRNEGQQRLKVLIHCTKTPSSEYDKYPRLKSQDHTFTNIERYKEDHGIVTIADSTIALPVIISIENRFPFDINNISIETFVQFQYGNEADRIAIDIKHPDLIRSDQEWHEILFDMSGFSKTLFDIGKVSYNKISSAIPLNQLTTNMPYLIDSNEIQNQYNGFKDLNEMKIDFLLRNYISSSFLARGWLLKIMFSKLKEITNTKKIELDNRILDLGESDLAILQGLIQIDIISKIMMYLEDLAILSNAMQVSNGNYYELLDRSDSQSIELGDRISLFLDDVYNNKISQKEYRRILGYYNPDEWVTTIQMN